MWSAKTFRNKRQCLKSFFNWCVREGLLKSNPVEKIEKPKLPQRLPRFINKEEALTVIAHAEFYPWRYSFEKVRNLAIIATFIMTGLRLNELINLKVHDVDFQSGEIFVEKGKGRKERIIPIYPKLQLSLSTYINERRRLGAQSKYFFHSARSTQKLTPKTVQNICRKVSGSSGIKFTPHSLRHTFGHLSTDAGLGLYQLKDIMGHSTVSTTEIYSSISKEGLKRKFFETELF